MPIDEQIGQQETVVLAMKKYDTSVEKLALMVGKKKLERKEMLELLKTISGSFDKIKAFVKG